MTGILANMHDKDFAIGCTETPFTCESDLALNTDFFSTFPQDVYIIELQATNGQNATGFL